MVRPGGKCVLQRDGADENARHPAKYPASERDSEGDVATIESELDTETAMDFILGADNKQQNKLTGWLGEMASITPQRRFASAAQSSSSDAW
jgi:hypothetical protein